MACQCDPCYFVLELAAAVTRAGGRRWDEWASQLKAAEVKKEAANKAVASVVAQGRDGSRLVNPLSLLMAMEDTMAEDSIMVADGGDFVGTASYIVRPRGPLRWLDPGAFGTLGVGGGFALGAKLCRPESEVWLIWGDGSCGYSVAEYDTFARHGVPIIALVGNDAGWTQIEREQVCVCVCVCVCVVVGNCGFAGGSITGRGPSNRFQCSTTMSPASLHTATTTPSRKATGAPGL